VIGIFDSGLGGLTVLRRVRELLPAHDLLYYADQANVPYGDRSPGELFALTERNVQQLNAAGVKAIVMACNTSCATASEFGWPPSDVPILDLIESAALAVKDGGYRNVGVIATAATARSGAYALTIGEIQPGTHVTEIAAPALVPLVEAGNLHGEEAYAAVADACGGLPADVDAVVLACTHYPLLSEHFRAVLGERAPIIDPAIRHAQRAARLVAQLNLLAGSAATYYVTSGNPQRFRENLERLIGDFEPGFCVALGSEGLGAGFGFARESAGL